MIGGTHLTFDARPSAFRYMLRGVLPVARRMELTPDISARWLGHGIDGGVLEGFRRISGLSTDGAVPILYPHTVGFRLAMVILTHPAFPVPIWKVLQTRNHLLQHRPIPVDARVDLEARCASGRFVEKGAEFDLHTTARVGGELCWESVVTFFARGRFGVADPPSPLSSSPPPPAGEVARFELRDGGHWAFGTFTGDYNGIHFSDWYARRFRFPSALYHPPRVLAECLARLPAPDRASPRRMDVWLKGPVHHGATVRLDADPGPLVTRFALFPLTHGERPAVVGRIGRVSPDHRLLDADGRPSPPRPFEQEVPT